MINMDHSYNKNVLIIIILANETFYSFKSNETTNNKFYVAKLWLFRINMYNKIILDSTNAVRLYKTQNHTPGNK